MRTNFALAPIADLRQAPDFGVPRHMSLVDPRRASTYSQDLMESCLARLKAKTKVRQVLIREMLLADEVALATHTDEDLRKVMDRFSHACREFELTISIKKTNVMGQDVIAPPPINTDNVTLDVVDQFIYLGSTITSNLSLDAEINMQFSCPS